MSRRTGGNHSKWFMKTNDAPQINARRPLCWLRESVTTESECRSFSSYDHLKALITYMHTFNVPVFGQTNASHQANAISSFISVGSSLRPFGGDALSRYRIEARSSA